MGIDFSLTDAQREVQRTARAFAEREILPRIRDLDESATYDRSLYEKMGAEGFLGLPIPERYGGAGMDYISFALLCEEMERADTAFRVILSVHTGLNSLTLLQWGSEEQKQKYLVPQARGEKLYFMLAYLDHGPSTWEHAGAPQEYAEFLLAVFQHMQSKYGFVPDAIEVVNEPDNSSVAFTPAQLGPAVAAAGQRLRAAGFDPIFVSPSTASMSRATPRGERSFACAYSVIRAPCTYSMTRYGRPSSVVPASITRAMFGCESRASTRRSRRNRCALV